MNYPGRTGEGGYIFKRDDPPLPPLKSTSTTPGFVIAGIVVGVIALIVVIVGCVLVRRHYRRLAEDRVGFDILAETKLNRQSMLQTGVSIHYPIVPAPPVPLLAPAPSFRSFSKRRGPPRPRHDPGIDYGHSRSNTNTSVSSYESAASTPTNDMAQVDTRSLSIITMDLQNLQSGQTLQGAGDGGYGRPAIRATTRGQPIYRQSTIEEAYSPIDRRASSSLPYGSANQRPTAPSSRPPDPSIYDDVVTRRSRPSTKQPPAASVPPPDPGDAAPADDGVRRGRSRKRRTSISYPQPAALVEPEALPDAVPRGLPPASRRSGMARPSGSSPPRDPSRPIAVFSPATAVDNKRFSFKPKPSRSSTLVPTPQFKLVVDDTTANEGKVKPADQT